MAQDAGPGGGDAVGTSEFNRFTQGLDYPVFVVTTTDGRERSGCLVGFTTQVSIHPPRMLVCLSVQNHTHRVAADAELLAVHVLEEGQRELSELFGSGTGDEIDKFARCDWHSGPGGVPLLDDCPQHLVGRIVARTPFGDHTGHLLEPVQADGAEGEPLTFQEVSDLEPGHEA